MEETTPILRSAAMAFIFGCAIGSTALADPMNFEVHEIARPGGRAFGQTSLADVDRDGDLDFISGRRDGPVFWFEYRGADDWRTHRIGGRPNTDVGGVAFDIDGDGWVDQVSGGVWYRNPGNPRQSKFDRFENGAIPTHDNVVGDINGDGRPELVSQMDKRGLFWYRIPDDPTEPWGEHEVIGKTDPQCHGGVAVGDLDGDGDLDLTRVDRWFENADEEGGEWIEHRAFDFGKVGPWGLMTRARIVDVDGDGDPDLVQAEGDVLNGRVAWFENVDGNAQRWDRHIIKTAGHDQDFHSLCMADFDNDGDPDIFSGGGPLTEGRAVWFIWENHLDEGEPWEEHVIATGKRTHESVCGDIDGDGDIDIATKGWDRDLHLFAENRLNRP